MQSLLSSGHSALLPLPAPTPTPSSCSSSVSVLLNTCRVPCSKPDSESWTRASSLPEPSLGWGLGRPPEEPSELGKYSREAPPPGLGSGGEVGGAGSGSFPQLCWEGCRCLRGGEIGRVRVAGLPQHLPFFSPTQTFLSAKRLLILEKKIFLINSFIEI